MKRQVTTTKTMPLGPQKRFFSIQRADVNQDNRSVPLCFSSEAPVERYWGIEILDHSPGSVRMDRLRSSAALLCDHNWNCQVGVVESPSIDADRKGRAVGRFSQANPRAVQEYQDVLDGIRSNLSVGYIIHAMVLESEIDGLCTYRVTDWEPYEISTVSVPADISVGVGRDHRHGEERDVVIQTIVWVCDDDENETDNESGDAGTTTGDSACDPGHHSTEDRTMKCPKCQRDMVNGACSCGHRDQSATPNPVIDVKAVQEQARNEEMHRVREIQAIADKHPSVADMAREFISSGKPLDEFRAAALEKIANATPVQVSADLGMSNRDLSRYSIVRAMHQIATGGHLDGIEREASEATAKIIKREARGFFIPQDIMSQKRALSAGTATGGGFTIDSQHMYGDMIELLRNKTLVSRMGARTLSGLVGNVAIPRVTGGANAYWLPESGTVTATDQSFGQLGLIPRRLVGDTAYTKELLIQSSIDVENFVREDLMMVLGIEKDRAAINGLGANGEPLGILNTTGIGSVTFGAAATWAKIISFETAVANANADIGRMAYLTTPSCRGVWKGAVKVTNQASFLWENGDGEFGVVNGYPAAATKQVPSDKVIFGNWNDLVIAEWAGVDVVVDPYSLKKDGKVEITITLWADLGVRHPGSFAVSSDSGAQ